MSSMPPNLVSASPRGSIAGIALMAAGIALVLWAAHSYQTLRTLNTELTESATAHAELKRQSDKRRSNLPKPDAERIVASGQTRPLAPTLAWLEQTWTDELAYQRIDVDGASRTQRLDIEARHDDALLALVDALSAIPAVTNASLVRQRRGDASVEATLQLRWQELSR